MRGRDEAARHVRIELNQSRLAPLVHFLIWSHDGRGGHSRTRQAAPFHPAIAPVLHCTAPGPPNTSLAALATLAPPPHPVQQPLLLATAPPERSAPVPRAGSTQVPTDSLHLDRRSSLASCPLLHPAQPPPAPPRTVPASQLHLHHSGREDGAVHDDVPPSRFVGTRRYPRMAPVRPATLLHASCRSRSDSSAAIRDDKLAEGENAQSEGRGTE